MSNTITIELCAEDRARLDRLAEALERKACDKCVNSALEALNHARTPSKPDPVQEALAKAIQDEPAEAPQEPAGATEAETPATTQAEEEKPTAEESAPEAEVVEPTVTLEQIQQKVLRLASANGGAKKAAVREIINTYGAKVSDLKDQPDKWTEVWNKLTELEVKA